MITETNANQKKGLSEKEQVLPVKGSLGFLFSVSWFLAFLLLFTVLFGIIGQNIVYPKTEVLLAFLPVDFFHIVIGLPVLVISLILAKRGSLVGLLCWPGSLIYILYSFTTNFLGVPFGYLFLPYLLLVTLSAYSIFGIALMLDFKEIQKRLSGSIPYKAGGSFLIIVTALFVLLAFSQVITALLNGETPGAMEIMLWTADLTTISPLCLIGGVLLFRRKPVGLAAGPGLFLAYAMLFLGLLPVMIYQAIYSGTSIEWIGFGMMAVFGIVCLVFLIIFLRAIDRKG